MSEWTPVMEKRRWTTADLELMPDSDTRYEIIEGELFMSKQPHWHHQTTCGNIYARLHQWSMTSKLGQASVSPGVIFGEYDAVVPDVVWMSYERLDALLDEAGHVMGAPELAVEVLSVGSENERRDRELKLKLYERQGVQEYWIVDWRLRQVTVYRRMHGPPGAVPGRLHLEFTLFPDDTMTSPLLPGFSCQIADFFSQ
jgi:Uma2 family endonuclease